MEFVDLLFFKEYYFVFVPLFVVRYNLIFYLKVIIVLFELEPVVGYLLSERGELSLNLLILWHF